MTTTEIKAKIYDLLVLIEQAKNEINQLQTQLVPEKPSDEINGEN